MSTTPEVMTTPDVVVPVADVYWRPGCPYCAALRRDLLRLKVPTRWHNIWDDPDASQFVRSVNAGNETVPTVRVGSTTLTNPRGVQVATLVGVTAEPPPDIPRRGRWVLSGVPTRRLRLLRRLAPAAADRTRDPKGRTWEDPRSPSDPLPSAVSERMLSSGNCSSGSWLRWF